MRWWAPVYMLIAGMVLLLTAPNLTEQTAADHSVVTLPAPPPTLVATAEPTGNAVATSRPVRSALTGESQEVSATPEVSTATPPVETPQVSEVPLSENSPAPTPDDPAPSAVPGLAEVPHRLRIDSIGFDRELYVGGLSPQGKIDPPQGVAMWYNGHGRVPPGQVGTGVIAGHVAYGNQPDIFAGLDGVQPGDEVTLDYSAGSTLTLRVVSVERITKDELEHSTDVWGSHPDVRRVAIITCSDEGGIGPDGYRIENRVVIAELDA